jgi:hypothetical protein
MIRDGFRDVSPRADRSFQITFGVQLLECGQHGNPRNFQLGSQLPAGKNFLPGPQAAADNGGPKPIVQLDVHRLRRVIGNRDWREEVGTAVFHPGGKMVMSIFHGTVFVEPVWESVLLVLVLVLGSFPTYCFTCDSDG